MPPSGCVLTRQSREQGHEAHCEGSTLVAYLPKAPAPNTITLQSWVSIYGFGQGTHRPLAFWG